MLVQRFLEDAAVRNPEATALVDARGTATYDQLDRLANQFANLLIESGVRRADRVVIAIENCITFVGAYMGTMKAGAVAVPLPAGPRSDRLAHAVTDCAPAAALIDAATAREIGSGLPLATVRSLFVSATGALPETGVAFTHIEPALQSCDAVAPPVRCIDLDLAAIIYTSGSTGEPRGVMLTHRNIVANTRSIVEYLRLTGSDRVMCVLPFYYVYGLSLLHSHLAVSGTVVIDNRFAFPNVVLQAMRQHSVTGFAGVPSTFALLLHRCELDAVPLPALRYATQAGGGMAPALVAKWLQRGWPVPFYVMYGATEASARLTFLDPALLHEKAGSIGRPIPNVEILVVREDGSRAEPGETGELVARGSNIAQGYWNNVEETAQRFGPLGYRTGDLGYMDDDGFLFLVGRRHDMIKVGAHRVGAKEIEDILHEFPGVHEVAVVPAPHELLGQVPIAFLSLTRDAEFVTEALQAFCRSRLPAHKVPARFVIRAELPKLGTIGKIDKALLLEQARDNAGTVAAR
jgi:long-chain acyl-CoA synthetase